MDFQNFVKKVSLFWLGFFLFSCNTLPDVHQKKISSHSVGTTLLFTGLNKNIGYKAMGFKPFLKYTKIYSEGIESEVLESQTGKIYKFKNENLNLDDSLYLENYEVLVSELSNLKFSTQLDSFIILCEGKRHLMHLWNANGSFYKTYDLVTPNSKELPAFGFYVEGLPIVSDSLVFFRLFKSEVYVDDAEKWKKVTEDAPLYKLNLNTGVIHPFGEYPEFIKKGKHYGYPFINSRKGMENELVVSHPKNHNVELYNLNDGNKTTVLFSPKPKHIFEEYSFDNFGSTKYSYEYQVQKSQFTHAGYDEFSNQYYRFYLDCSENKDRCILTLTFTDTAFKQIYADTLEYGKYIDNIRFFDGGYYLEQYIKTDSLINYAYEKFLWD